MLKATDIIDFKLLQRSDKHILVEEAYLPSGPELDKIVAERVMDFSYDGNWSPSTDLNHAWQVWKQLPLRRSLQIIWSEGDDRTTIACGNQDEWEPFSKSPVFVSRENLCTTICYAALVALYMVEATKTLKEGQDG